MSVETTVQTSPGLEAFVGRAAGHGTALAAMGIPTRRAEAWRYTPLRAFADTVWAEAPALSDAQVQALLADLPLPEAGSRVVFANGRKFDVLDSLSESILVSAAEPVDPIEDRFSAVLNAALAQDGLSVRVAAGTDAGMLTLASLTSGDAVSTHLRHRIVLEEGASLTLYDLNAGEGRYVANPRFDIVVGKGARLTHVKLQQDSQTAGHLAIIAASVDAGGNYDSFTLNHGGELARHEVVSTLNAPHAQVHVNGIQIVDGNRLNDLTSMIHHAAPDCGSRQTVKTVLSENGQGVFQGKILVDRIAQKTDGYQMNQALLLSEKAQINSKPELEIYADDVKCSHGATVGALDDEQLFYLRSRGIPEAEARDILVRAFLLDALDLVTDEILRDLLQRSIRA
ncbi:iron-sulfur (Fe-S) assembly protein SufD [Gluconobacter thailandicus F149-1 = NBRC 100600]|uniref:ABC transporter permease n=1 Tax=Gluconobacter thailandicus NBRC 3257 TaxID=1381097 RepID=A0ABQ0ISE3_GLUTH|nr:Fe-S cluster assembly protein SufD [Gluconobacter thailandicus]KXV53292.1 ABC transporter permease [Gluconobacter thailandicus]GAC86946.1 ABC transporter permease [Gluconobacter thailandicus NBRC 3255]GAD25137.1 ABC transporter permease [Gluconobacter thailandicus NBRC 3257]GAN91913.1 iron-sulfur (Fe-S) assembly protein SufD [Gluconobacter thailandicus F149-1 = NBRC 100600]GBR59138.1 iron-sulfur assembly protein SufD [Gluconobacter thailandicus F149-1 = NBRC 100600]